MLKYNTIFHRTIKIIDRIFVYLIEYYKETENYEVKLCILIHSIE